MKYTKVCYLCDGQSCRKMCANMSKEEWSKYHCHHTLDESHAVNKNRRTRKFETTVDSDGTICYVEVEKCKKVKYEDKYEDLKDDICKYVKEGRPND